MKVINWVNCLLLSELVSSENCNNIRVRKNLKSLNEKERATYFSAFRKVMTEDPYRSTFTKMVNDHDKAGNRAHNSAYFFPWHREFLKKLEELLQKVDSSIMLPYCDWSENSSSPENSYIFTDKYFGGNGSGNNKCLANGQFKDIKVDYPKLNKCIQRDWNGGRRLGSFPSKAVIEVTLNKKHSYDKFRAEVEGAIHGPVHVNVGGRNGDMLQMHSPNDPFFFCHHAFIDFLWAEWQQRRGSGGNEFGGDGATASSTLWPWGSRVSEVFDTKNKKLCYQYDKHYKGPQASVKSVKALAVPEKPVEDKSGDDNIKAVSMDSEPEEPKRKPNGKSKSINSAKNSSQREDVKNKILTQMRSTKFIDSKSNELHEVALMIINGTRNGIKVDSMDRDADPDLIQSTNPLPEEWLKMMGFDIQEQREREAVQEAYAQAYNLIKVSEKPKSSIKVSNVQDRFQPKESIIDSIFKPFTLEDNMHLDIKIGNLVDIDIDVPNVIKPVEKTLNGVVNLTGNLLGGIL